jgi:hypothetical protein
LHPEESRSKSTARRTDPVPFPNRKSRQPPSEHAQLNEHAQSLSHAHSTPPRASSPRLVEEAPRDAAAALVGAAKQLVKDGGADVDGALGTLGALVDDLALARLAVGRDADGAAAVRVVVGLGADEGGGERDDVVGVRVGPATRALANGKEGDVARVGLNVDVDDGRRRRDGRVDRDLNGGGLGRLGLGGGFGRRSAVGRPGRASSRGELMFVVLCRHPIPQKPVVSHHPLAPKVGKEKGKQMQRGHGKCMPVTQEQTSV